MPLQVTSQNWKRIIVLREYKPKRCNATKTKTAKATKQVSRKGAFTTQTSARKVMWTKPSRRSKLRDANANREQHHLSVQLARRQNTPRTDRHKPQRHCAANKTKRKEKKQTPSAAVQRKPKNIPEMQRQTSTRKVTMKYKHQIAIWKDTTTNTEQDHVPLYQRKRLRQTNVREQGTSITTSTTTQHCNQQADDQAIEQTTNTSTSASTYNQKHVTTTNKTLSGLAAVSYGTRVQYPSISAQSQHKQDTEYLGPTAQRVQRSKKSRTQCYGRINKMDELRCAT